MSVQKHMKHEEGFTLVELSIVLVIIGLIIGGVLAGQDMIKAAEIRSQVSQLQGYDTAANTFKDKYRYLPGDILGSGAAATNTAVQVGLTTRTGADGNGDGDGTLEGCSAGAGGLLLGCETVLFWQDLNTMGLVDGSYATATNALVTAASTSVVTSYIPEAKLKSGNFVTVFSAAGRNYYQLAGVTSVAAGVYTLGALLTPQMAFNVDSKMDDGKPLTGSVRSAWSAAALNAVQAPPGSAAPYFVAGTAAGTAPTGILADCLAGDGAAAANTTYNLRDQDLANGRSCQLRVRTSF